MSFDVPASVGVPCLILSVLFMIGCAVKIVFYPEKDAAQGG